MKIFKLCLIIILSHLWRNSYGDIIPPNSHIVNKCVKITNVNDYPDISLLGVTTCMAFCPQVYVIEPATCLTKGYKLNCLMIYGVRKSYLAGKDITSIDWSKDAHTFKTNVEIDPAGDYADNANSIYSIDQYYKIVGFTDSSVELYKYREVDYYCNGSIAVISTGKYSGDSSKLSQTLPFARKANPEARRKELNLAHSECHVNIIMGNAIETKKIIIEKKDGYGL